MDDRITPAEIFEPLNRVHGFTIDVAANWFNSQCDRYIPVERDGLLSSWKDEVVWCNPPYSNIGAWLEKTHAEIRSGCRKVVLLLPNNRAEQGWWQKYIEPYREGRDATLSVETYFLSRRREFSTPNNPEAKYKTGVPFGLVVVIFRVS